LIDTLVTMKATRFRYQLRSGPLRGETEQASYAPGQPMCAILWPLAAKTAVVRKIEGHFYLLTEIY